MKTILETEQLLLRHFSARDGDFVMKLLNSPGWLEYIGNRDIHTLEEAQIYLLTGPVSSYEKLGYGLYLVALKDGEIPIGMCGLIKRDGLVNTDLGFAYLPDFTGKGYAFEAANAVVQHALSELRLKSLDAITLPHNDRAKKLLEKLGFVYRRNVRLPNEQTELLLYNLKRKKNQ